MPKILNFLDWREIQAPNLRRTKPTAIVRSGSRRTVFSCLCGETHSCATEWNGRNSRHVLIWRRIHDNSCDPVPKFIELENYRQAKYNEDC